MIKQTEALKLALEALKQIDEAMPFPVAKLAQKAIREALAEQPAQQDSETITQNFTGLPKRKLRYLLSAGWQINGVCFQRTEEDGTVRRGAATTGGMVLWWNTEQTAQQETVRDLSMMRDKSYGYTPSAEAVASFNAVMNAQQPAQQEPVAWKHDCAALLQNDVELWVDRCPHCGKPRTTPQAQPAQQELASASVESASVTYKEVADAMNALYMGNSKQVQIAKEMENKKLYTSPPAQRKPWVGLTDEEFHRIYDNGKTPAGMMELVESALREKNSQPYKPLTEEQITECWEQMGRGLDKYTAFARAIEAAHGITGEKK